MLLIFDDMLSKFISLSYLGQSLCMVFLFYLFPLQITLYSFAAAYNAIASSSAVEILGIEKIEYGIAVMFTGYGLANLVTPILAGMSVIQLRLKFYKKY